MVWEHRKQAISKHNSNKQRWKRVPIRKLEKRQGEVCRERGRKDLKREDKVTRRKRKERESYYLFYEELNKSKLEKIMATWETRCLMQFKIFCSAESFSTKAGWCSLLCFSNLVSIQFIHPPFLPIFWIQCECDVVSSVNGITAYLTKSVRKILPPKQHR